ncbi:MAG: hypothetical protein II156_08395 [Lachnospiraceae bacterium]|nr:hypothetical protein [Lachnospiraceae bacterium]
MIGGDFDIIPFMAKHRNHRKNKHNGLRGGSVTVVMEPEAEEAEPKIEEPETAEHDEPAAEQEVVAEPAAEIPAE